MPEKPEKEMHTYCAYRPEEEADKALCCEKMGRQLEFPPECRESDGSNRCMK